jgi:hypothetical protein
VEVVGEEKAVAAAEGEVGWLDCTHMFTHFCAVESGGSSGADSEEGKRMQAQC